MSSCLCTRIFLRTQFLAHCVCVGGGHTAHTHRSVRLYFHLDTFGWWASTPPPIRTLSRQCVHLYCPRPMSILPNGERICLNVKYFARTLLRAMHTHTLWLRLTNIICTIHILWACPYVCWRVVCVFIYLPLSIHSIRTMPLIWVAFSFFSAEMSLRLGWVGGHTVPGPECYPWEHTNLNLLFKFTLLTRGGGVVVVVKYLLRMWMCRWWWWW